MITGRQQEGFSLIELMVGLVIGLVAILVIGQVMAAFEDQKRTNTGGSDAQTNGSAALQVLEQELRMAGYGLLMPSLSGTPFNGNQFCPLGVNIQYSGAVLSDPGAATPAPSNTLLSPVRIVDGGAAGVPDQIIVVRSDAEIGVLASTVQANVALGAASPTITVDSKVGYDNPGQLVLIGAADGSKICTVMQVSAAPTQNVINTNNWDLKFAQGASYPYNPAIFGTTFASFAGASPTTYGAGDKVVNLGFSPTPPASSATAYRPFMYRRYSVLQCNSQPQLAMDDLSQTTAAPSCANSQILTDEIVDMQAQYGIAVSGALNVSQWVDATGNWASNNLTAARINQIKAIRIAVVSRSPQYIKNDATCSANPVATASIVEWAKLNAGDDAPATFTVPVGADTCQHYRYKVFTTVVPLKNAIWSRLCYDPTANPCS